MLISGPCGKLWGSLNANVREPFLQQLGGSGARLGLSKRLLIQSEVLPSFKTKRVRGRDHVHFFQAPREVSAH